MRFSTVNIEKLLGLPAQRDVVPNQFYLIEGTDYPTEFYISDSKSNLILLNEGGMGDIEPVWGAINQTVFLVTYGNTQAGLEDAIAAIGATPTELRITSQITITSNVSIPSNIQVIFTGHGSFYLEEGVTLTIGLLGAMGVKRYFFGPGNVVIGFGGTAGVFHLEWWSGPGSSGLDSRHAFDQVKLSAIEQTQTDQGQGILYIGPGEFLMEAGFELWHHCTIEGVGYDPDAGAHDPDSINCTVIRITEDSNDSVIVRNAGTSAANGTYTLTGQVNGKNYYNKSGTSSTVSSIFWDGFSWQINSSAGASLYVSDDDVATPNFTTTWAAVGGALPLPTVTAYLWRIPDAARMIAIKNLTLSTFHEGQVGTANCVHWHQVSGSGGGISSFALMFERVAFQSAYSDITAVPENNDIHLVTPAASLFAIPNTNDPELVHVTFKQCWFQTTLGMFTDSVNMNFTLDSCTFQPLAFGTCVKSNSHGWFEIINNDARGQSGGYVLTKTPQRTIASCNVTITDIPYGQPMFPTAPETFMFSRVTLDPATPEADRFGVNDAGQDIVFAVPGGVDPFNANLLEIEDEFNGILAFHPTVAGSITVGNPNGTPVALTGVSCTVQRWNDFENQSYCVFDFSAYSNQVNIIGGVDEAVAWTLRMGGNSFDQLTMMGYTSQGKIGFTAGSAFQSAGGNRFMAHSFHDLTDGPYVQANFQPNDLIGNHVYNNILIVKRGDIWGTKSNNVQDLSRTQQDFAAKARFANDFMSSNYHSTYDYRVNSRFFNNGWDTPEGGGLDEPVVGIFDTVRRQEEESEQKNLLRIGLVDDLTRNPIYYYDLLRNDYTGRFEFKGNHLSARGYDFDSDVKFSTFIGDVYLLDLPYNLDYIEVPDQSYEIRIDCNTGDHFIGGLLITGDKPFPVDGEQRRIVNVGTTVLSLGNEYTTTGPPPPVSRFLTDTSETIVLRPGEAADLSFDADAIDVDGRWRVFKYSGVFDTFVTNDSLLELATLNTGDALDIGFYGKYVSGGNKYSGLFRDASDGYFRLFSGLEVQPTTTVDTTGAGFTYANLRVGNLTAADIVVNSVDTPFTEGSIVFAGASGILSQDNGALFWDATNDRLGIGVGSDLPARSLEVGSTDNWQVRIGDPLNNDLFTYDIGRHSSGGNAGLLNFYGNQTGNIGYVFSGIDGEFARLTSTGLTLADPLGTASGGLGVALTDPGDDRILFWDDSAGAHAYLTAGTGLSITGTTISATASGYTDEQAQDAVGAMVDTTIVYTDEPTPLLSRAALTGAITASAGSNTTALGSFTKADLDTAISDGNVVYSGTDATLEDLTVSSLTTPFTTGSVLYIGASGLMAQDNGAFKWDATNDKLGIGVGGSAPARSLEVRSATEDYQLRLGGPTGGSTENHYDIGRHDGTGYLNFYGNQATGGNVAGYNFGGTTSGGWFATLDASGLALGVPLSPTYGGNATHTGEVTGATALTVHSSAITGKTAVTAVSGDYVLISDTSDSGNLKKALVSDLAGTPYTTEQAQDAVGAMTTDGSLVYVDEPTALLTRGALTGAITASQGSNTTALGSFTKSQLDAAITDGNVIYVGDSPTFDNLTVNTLLTIGPSGGIDTPFTAGSVVFAGTSGVLNQDNGVFFYDAGNDRLGIGTAVPQQTLDVSNSTDIQIRIGDQTPGVYTNSYSVGRVAGGGNAGFLNFYGNQNNANGYIWGGNIGGVVTEFGRLSNSGLTLTTPLARTSGGFGVAMGDPGADRVVGWRESTDSFAYFSPLANSLAISGLNLHVADGDKGDITTSSSGTAWSIDSSAITGKTAVTALGADYVLISDTSDSGNLKKALISDFATGGTVDTDGSTPALGRWARFTDSNTLEGRTNAQLLTDVGLDPVWTAINQDLYLTTNTQAGLETAIASIVSGGVNTRLIITSQVSITSSLSGGAISSLAQIVFQGKGSFTVSNGVTVTINACAELENRQYFFGLGYVVFGRNAVSEFNLTWWHGTVSDLNADPALTAAFTSLTNNFGGKLNLPPINMLTNGGKVLPTGSKLRGSGDLRTGITQIQLASGQNNTNVFTIPEDFRDITLEDLTLDCNTNTGCKALRFYAASALTAGFGFIARNVGFRRGEYGTHVDDFSTGTWQAGQVVFENCHWYHQTVAAFYSRATDLGLSLLAPLCDLAAGVDFMRIVNIGSLFVSNPLLQGTNASPCSGGAINTAALAGTCFKITGQFQDITITGGIDEGFAYYLDINTPGADMVVNLMGNLVQSTTRISNQSTVAINSIGNDYRAWAFTCYDVGGSGAPRLYSHGDMVRENDICGVDRDRAIDNFTGTLALTVTEASFRKELVRHQVPVVNHIPSIFDSVNTSPIHSSLHTTAISYLRVFERWGTATAGGTPQYYYDWRRDGSGFLEVYGNQNAANGYVFTGDVGGVKTEYARITPSGLTLATPLSAANGGNATHTGEVTGATALTVHPTAITGKTTVTAVGSDYVLISDTSDSGNLKKALVSDFAGSGGVDTSGTPEALDFARFTDLNTIEGRTYAEVRSDLGLGTMALQSATDFSGLAAFEGFGVKTETGYPLYFYVSDDLSQARGLTFDVNNADRTLSIPGNATVSGTNTGDQTITLTGDVTGSGTGSFAASIASNAVTTAKILDSNVTLAKIENIPAGRILGNNTGGSAPVTALTSTNAKAVLGLGSTDVPTFGGLALLNSSSHLNKGTVTRDIPTTGVDYYVNLGSITIAHSAHNFKVTATVAVSSFSVAKQWDICASYDATGGNWRVATPTKSSVYAPGGNDFVLDIKVGTSACELRFRRTAGSSAAEAQITFENYAYQTVGLALSSSTGYDNTVTGTYP